MKKRVIIAAAFTACLALWGAVSPRTVTVEETLPLASTPAITAPEPTVAEVKLETEIDLPTEKEKAVTPQPDPTPVEASATPNTQPQKVRRINNEIAVGRF